MNMPIECLIMTTGLFCAGRIVIRVRFPDRQTGIQGLALLIRDGEVVDCCGSNTFGLHSSDQLNRLSGSGLAFEILKNEQ